MDMSRRPLPCQAGASHYDLMGVSPRTNTSELRHAFCTLSKQFHPDTTTLPAAEAAECFAALKSAYSILGDPAARHRYDLLLQSLPSEIAVRPAQPATGQPVLVPVMSSRRPLSPGEWFSLMMMGGTVLCCVGLAVVLGWSDLRSQ